MFTYKFIGCLWLSWSGSLLTSLFGDLCVFERNTDVDKRILNVLLPLTPQTICEHMNHVSYIGVAVFPAFFLCIIPLVYLCLCRSGWQLMPWGDTRCPCTSCPGRWTPVSICRHASVAQASLQQVHSVSQWRVSFTRSNSGRVPCSEWCQSGPCSLPATGNGHVLSLSCDCSHILKVRLTKLLLSI